MKNSAVAVLKGSKREIDSVKAIGSMECEEPNALELDEYAEELQDVFDSISGVRLDPELLSASRKVEIDFMKVWRCIASDQKIGRRTRAFMSSQRNG